MASPRSIEVKVGILILTAIGLLATFILVMGGVNFQPKYSIYVEFDNPGGLQTGAPVKIAGVEVGKLSEIHFRGGQVGKDGRREPLVRIQLRVEERYQQSIHDNATFYVTTQGVLGEQFLAIEPGSTDRPVLPANAVVRGLDPPRLDMLLAEGYELLHATVTAMREHREEVGEAFDGLRKTLKGTGDFMHRNQDRLDRIAENVEQISLDGTDLVKDARQKYVNNPQIDRILSNADQVSSTAARDLPPLMADARETLANARRLSTTVGGEPEQAKIRKTLDDIAEIAGKARAATADAQEVLAHVKRGKGTVGALVMDEQLFDDLQELARDLKHNPWKFFWRESGKARTPAGPGGQASLISGAPSVTAAPSVTRISSTVPSSSASTGISIFMDSRMTTTVPSSTLSPGLTSIFQTVPVMCALMTFAMGARTYRRAAENPTGPWREAPRPRVALMSRAFPARACPRPLSGRYRSLGGAGARGGAGTQVRGQRTSRAWKLGVDAGRGRWAWKRGSVEARKGRSAAISAGTCRAPRR